MEIKVETRFYQSSLSGVGMIKVHPSCEISGKCFLAHQTCPSAAPARLPHGPSSLPPWPVWHPSPFLGPWRKKQRHETLAAGVIFLGGQGCLPAPAFLQASALPGGGLEEPPRMPGPYR